jgi:AP-1-like factor
LSSETENQHLKELLKRLQDENVSLRNTAFTFTVPRSGEHTDTSFNAAIPTFAPSPPSLFSTPSHLPSPSSSDPTKATTPQSSLDTPSSFPGDIDFGSLNPLDPSAMDLLDDSDAIMSYDFGGYGQVIPSKTPYKTIASNPMYMSFADPIVPETPTSKSLAPSSGSSSSGGYGMTFGQWTRQTSSHEASSHAGSLDELFGGHIFAAQSPINFNVLLNSAATSPAASAMSPIIHQSMHTPASGPSSTSSPIFESPDASSSAHGSSGHSECPKTRAQMEQRIQAEGSSIFAPLPPQEKESRSQVFRAPAGADGPMIMCQGATFPMTEKSDKNIEVLTAWRNITSHPDFKASVSSSPT